MFDATVVAVAERAKANAEASAWTQTHELLAVNAELTHALLSAFIQANSKKARSLKPFRIRRPGETEKNAVQTLTHAALMELVKEV